MVVYKGGRGLKAPYETTVVRVPLPLKDEVIEMVEAYKNTGSNPLVQKLVTSNEAIELARNILRQKKSAKLSLEKLLSSLYGINVSL